MKGKDIDINSMRNTHQEEQQSKLAAHFDDTYHHAKSTHASLDSSKKKGVEPRPKLSVADRDTGIETDEIESINSRDGKRRKDRERRPTVLSKTTRNSRSEQRKKRGNRNENTNAWTEYIRNREKWTQSTIIKT